MCVVFAHVALALTFIFLIDLPSGSKVQEINAPLTLAYVSAVLAWLFRQDASEDARPINPFLMAAIVMIVLPFFAALFYIPISFVQSDAPDLESLNSNFLKVEFFFGALFGMIMTELFGYQRPNP
ncbi:hypothetical protein [Tabrizicola sp.]|uniref:hypothetical protein n=1 Tax=Tabrizicola sp. TaxID=2005166 RepID=UPI0025EF0F6E|nr:hypothetical protein [Tabrizicola sp.]